MSILNAIVKWLGGPAEYTSLDIGTRQGRYRPTDARSLVGHNKGWAYICASRNAETIAGVPLRLYVRGGTRSYYGKRPLSAGQKSYLSGVLGKAIDDDVEEITEGHPLLDLLQNVNDELTTVELLEATVNYQELVGDAYWFKERGPLNVPVALHPLMSQYVRVVRDSQAKLVGYLYGKTETNRVAFDAQDVIHFRYPNPRDPDYGLSPLEATFGATALLEAQQEYATTMFDAGGMPEVGIIVKGDVNAAERAKLYAEWKSKFGSKRKGDKAIVLQGDMDIKTFGYNPSDTGLEFTQKFSREEVCAAFGVPLTMVQLNEASRAGAEAGNYAYMQFTIAPKLRRIEQKLNEELASEFDARLFFAFDNPVPGDKAMRLQEIATRLGTKMTCINEERAIDGMVPVEWGEEPEKPQPFLMPGQAPAEEPEADKPETEEPEAEGCGACGDDCCGCTDPNCKGDCCEDCAAESAKCACGRHHKAAMPPLTAGQRRFSDMLESYMIDVAREVDGKLRAE